MSNRSLLQDAHVGLLKAEYQTSQQLCHGSYLYYHYCCDGVDDRGWGCGYRTLQTICSWLLKQGCFSIKDGNKDAPTLEQIQSALVQMQDKPPSFHGSKQWIGSFEICLCLDFFYEVPCKIIHLNEGRDIKNHLEELVLHFRLVGCPIMMGGETDCASKAIVGVCLDNPALLIVDPHCYQFVHDAKDLQSQGYVRWMPVSELHSSSFYNLCIPKPSVNKT